MKLVLYYHTEKAFSIMPLKKLFTVDLNRSSPLTESQLTIAEEVVLLETCKFVGVDGTENKDKMIFPS